MTFAVFKGPGRIGHLRKALVLKKIADGLRRAMLFDIFG